MLEPGSRGADEGAGRVIGASVQGVLREQRSGATDRDVVSAILGLPFVGLMRQDPKVVAALIRGEPVGVRTSPVALLADAILAEALPASRGAA